MYHIKWIESYWKFLTNCWQTKIFKTHFAYKNLTKWLFLFEFNFFRIPYGDSPTSPLPSPIHSPVMNHFPHTLQVRIHKTRISSVFSKTNSQLITLFFQHHPLYQPLNMQSSAFSLRHPAMVANENSVCSTLFVANLGQSCTEAELHNLFSR
jgi:hypothetical protein